MTEPLLSSSWYRVAQLKPRVRSHARLHRMHYRGELWYLLQDPVSNRVHRFSPAARLLVAAMNGERSVEQLWEIANRKLGDEAPTQDEVIRLLGQLHAADLLQSGVPPDVTEVFERGERQERAQRRRAWMNPMALRLHLVDPDRFLNAIRPAIDFLWGPWGAVLWLAVMLPALLMLPAHWPELTGNFSERIMGSQNLVLLYFAFPVVKALHEFGHAAATKRGGGEVHDMGIVTLVLMPVPYVEASASSVFRSAFQRALVGASGMLVELFVAALAFYAWLLLEPGVPRAVMFNVMVIAGVSTLVFNGNPLLRYDAYYILADLLGMPNLASRAMRYWGYLADRYAFGARDLAPPEHTRREKAWLLAYGLLSTAYRLMVTVAIAIFIAGQFFFIGVLLALWAVAAMAIVPLAKGLRHLGAPGLRRQRTRVVAVTAGFTAAVLLLLFVVPAPSRTMVEGVAWLPSSALVRAGQEGFVREVLARPGARVHRGELLVQLRNPALEAALVQSQARITELEANYLASLHNDRAHAAVVQEQLQAERTVLASAQERVDLLALRAEADGVFMLPRPLDLPGRFQKQGDLVAYVIDRPQPVARVVAPQDAVDLVRNAAQRVQVRMAHAPGQVLPARIAREVPAGEEYLPSKALATEGGGQLATDVRDPHGGRTFERTFQFDLDVEVAPGAVPLFFGERVHARIEHPPEPIGQQWLRAGRRLFLSHFHV